MSKTIEMKYYKSWYLGWKVGRKGLGFLTPSGTDSAAKNRKKTVDRWSSPDCTYEIENLKPMNGYQLVGEVGATGLRVADPRGFILELKEQAINYIATNTTIVNGFITEPCIWMRKGSDNYLVPISSNEYKDAIENLSNGKTSSSSKSNLVKLKQKDVKSGDIINSPTKRKIYLGKLELSYKEVKFNRVKSKSHYGYDSHYDIDEESEMKTFKCYVTAYVSRHDNSIYGIEWTKSFPTAYTNEGQYTTSTPNEILDTHLINKKRNDISGYHYCYNFPKDVSSIKVYSYKEI